MRESLGREGGENVRPFESNQINTSGLWIRRPRLDKSGWAGWEMQDQSCQVPLVLAMFVEKLLSGQHDRTHRTKRRLFCLINQFANFASEPDRREGFL